MHNKYILTLLSCLIIFTLQGGKREKTLKIAQQLAKINKRNSITSAKQGNKKKDKEKKLKSIINNKGYDCAICLDTENSTKYVGPCGHQFHSNCVARWKRNVGTCPLCKKDLRNIIVIGWLKIDYDAICEIIDSFPDK